MIRVLLLVLPIFAFSDSLKDIIEKAQNNEMVKQYDYQLLAKDKEKDYIESKDSLQLTSGANLVYIKNIEPTNAFLMGADVSPSLNVKASMSLYDGGLVKNSIKEIEQSKKTIGFNKEGTKKQIAFNVTKLYFTILDFEEERKSLIQKGKMLSAQQSRLEKFFGNNLVTEDEVENIKSVNYSNKLQITQLKHAIDELKTELIIMTNNQVDSIDAISFDIKQMNSNENTDRTKALISQSKELDYKIKQIESNKLPKVYFEDKLVYNYYSEEDEVIRFGGNELFNPIVQNTMVLNLSYDIDISNKTQNQREMVLNQKMVLNQQMEYEKRKDKYYAEIAKKAVLVAKEQISTAKQSLESSKKSYELIEKKYNARLVDNVVYLDSLSSLTNAESIYKKSLNNYQLKLAEFYYVSGYDVKEFVK